MSKPRDGNDLAALLMMIHNNKYPDNIFTGVSHSKLTHIKQNIICVLNYYWIHLVINSTTAHRKYVTNTT